MRWILTVIPARAAFAAAYLRTPAARHPMTPRALAYARAAFHPTPPPPRMPPAATLPYPYHRTLRALHGFYARYTRHHTEHAPRTPNRDCLCCDAVAEHCWTYRLRTYDALCRLLRFARLATITFTRPRLPFPARFLISHSCNTLRRCQVAVLFVIPDMSRHRSCTHLVLFCGVRDDRPVPFAACFAAINSYDAPHFCLLA